MRNVHGTKRCPSCVAVIPARARCCAECEKKELEKRRQAAIEKAGPKRGTREWPAEWMSWDGGSAIAAAGKEPTKTAPEHRIERVLRATIINTEHEQNKLVLACCECRERVPSGRMAFSPTCMYCCCPPCFWQRWEHTKSHQVDKARRTHTSDEVNKMLALGVVTMKQVATDPRFGGQW